MNHRAQKKFENKMISPVQMAYYEGETAGAYGNTLSPHFRKNPYPAGKRHDEWNRGFNFGVLPGNYPN